MRNRFFVIFLAILLPTFVVACNASDNRGTSEQASLTRVDIPPSPAITLTASSTRTPQPSATATPTSTMTPMPTSTPLPTEMSAEDLARSLGWQEGEFENAKVFESTAEIRILEDDKNGVMGFKLKGGEWTGTKGWIEEMKKGLYYTGVRQGASNNWYMMGAVVDVINNEFPIDSPGGRNLGVNKLAYLQAHVASNDKLGIRVIPLVVVDENAVDGFIVTKAGWSSDLGYVGSDPTMKNALSYFKSILTRGIMVEIGFVDSVENFDQFLKHFAVKAHVKTDIIDTPSFKAWRLARRSVDGLSGLAAAVESGINNGEIIIPVVTSSIKSGGWGQFKLP